MKYTEFVKANFPKVAHLPIKERMAELGKMWRASGHADKKVAMKGKGVAGGIFIKRKAGKVGKKGRKTKGGSVAGGDVAGGGILSSVLGAVGLGMKKRGRKAKGGAVAGGDVKGKGIISDALGMVGLGMKKPRRRGGAVAGGNVAGGGLLSSALSAFGLGLPDKVKTMHLNKMKMLEKKLHESGKLTPIEHNKLKVYHALHGAGFFDNLLGGVKKAAGSVLDNLDLVKKVIPQAAKFVPVVGKLAAPLAKIEKYAPLAKAVLSK